MREWIKKKNIENVTSFIVEKSVLEKLSLQNCKQIPRLFGAYYKLNGSSIHQVILVSECGDFNMLELLRERQKDKLEQNIKTPAYNEEEILEFLAHLVLAYEALQKARIYHSEYKTR